MYRLKGEQWSQKLLLNFTTDSNGLASFSVASPEHPSTEIILRVWCDDLSTHKDLTSFQYHFKANLNLKFCFVSYPEERDYRSFFLSTDALVYQLQLAKPYSPVFSELSIQSSEEPFKCGAEVPMTIYYIIVGKTTESFSIAYIYIERFFFFIGDILGRAFKDINCLNNKQQHT